MIARRISNGTHTFTEPPGWDQLAQGKCANLEVRVVRAPPNIYYESAWEPTPDELDMLNRGGSVILRVYGSQPPVALYVGDVPSADNPMEAAR